MNTTRTLAAVALASALLLPAAAFAQWAGPSVSASAGYGWNQHSGSSTCHSPTNGANGFGCTNVAYGGLDAARGTIGGGGMGYLWQRGSLAWGLEADYSFAQIRDTKMTYSPYNSNGTGVVGPGVNYTGYHKLGTLGTARAKLGYSGFTDWLPYVTAGPAWGRTEMTNVFAANGLSYITNTSSTRHGWVAGGGVERALGRGFALTAEALYYNLGRENYYAPATPALTNFWRSSDFTNAGVLARVGLRFRF